MTDEQQKIIDKAMKEASAYQLEVSAKDEEEGIKEMEKYGCEVNTLTDDQKKNSKSSLKMQMYSVWQRVPWNIRNILMRFRKN